MRIGKVAATVGCNIQTLRYYERRGLLQMPQRTASGYRQYAPDTVRLIRFIKRAQDLGFTLDEIEELLKLRDAKGKHRGEVRSVAKAKMRDIESKVTRLQAMHRALGGLVDACASRRPKTSCPILDALNDPNDEPLKMEGMTMTDLNRSARAYGQRVLLVLAGALLLCGAPGHVLAAGASAAVNDVQPSLKTVHIPVDGMACVACAANVKRTVKSLDGVSQVEMSLEKRTARVTYAADRISPERIAAAVDKLGYRAGIPREVK